MRIQSFTITEYDNTERCDHPIVGGVPLACGVVSNPDSITLHDQDGNHCPVQAEARSHWPDGSIRWLGISFKTNLAPLATQSYTLSLNDASQAPATTDIACMRDGRPLPIFPNSPIVDCEIRLIDMDNKQWTAASGETVIERSGFLHQTIRTQGILQSPDGSQAVHWQAWTDVFADTPWTQSNFVYGADASDVSFIPKPKAPNPVLEFSEFSIRIHLHESSNAEHCMSRSLWRSVTEGPFLSEKPLSQIQLDEQAWEIRSAGNVLDQGADKSEGYCGIHTANGGIGIGLGEIWQSHPKALRTGSDYLELALWPAECDRPLRIHAGAARSHRILLTPYDSPTELRDRVNGFATPILPRVANDDLNRTQAVPPQLSPINTKVPFVERQAEAMFPGFQSFANRDNMGVWGSGEWDWGDFRARLYEERNIPIGHGSGGIWANGEAQAGYAMLLQYLRTGHVDYLTMGLACARHKAGVDTVHSAKSDWQIGAQHIHCFEHATGQCVSCHTWTSELALGWFLTGDLWMKSVLTDTANHLVLSNQDKTDYRERAGGWLLIALCACHEGTGDQRCLETAARVARGLRNWIVEDEGRIWIPPSRHVHSPVHTFIAMTGLADYWRLTADPIAQEAILTGGELARDKGRDESGFFMTADAPGYRIYSQVPRWPLAQSLAALSILYEMTSDKEWLEIGMHQCRLFWRQTEAQSQWQPEADWPHEGSVYLAYAFNFLFHADQAGVLHDLAI